MSDNNSEIQSIEDMLGQKSLDWLKGDLEEKPTDIRMMGEDITQKMNWYLAGLVLSQFSRIPTLFDTLKQTSAMVQADVKNLSGKDLYETHKIVSSEIKGIMDFAKSYVVQNKENLADNANFFDRSLFEKIKTLSTDEIKDYLMLFQIVEKNGKHILKDIIEKYK